MTTFGRTEHGAHSQNMGRTARRPSPVVTGKGEHQSLGRYTCADGCLTLAARGRAPRALEDRVVGPPEPERVVGVERLELMML